jgi:Bor protein.
MRKVLAVFVLTPLLLTSCYNTKIAVGDVSPNQPLIKVNSHRNDMLLYGLVPLSNASKRATEFIGDRENYVIRTNHSFINGLLASLTFGIYTPTTTTYYIPLDRYSYNYRDNYSKDERNSPVEREPDFRDRTIQKRPIQETRATESRDPQIRQNPNYQERRDSHEQYQQSRNQERISTTNSGLNGYSATIYFKSGAKMDGIVTERASGDIIEIKLKSGLIIESKVKDIEKIEAR